jgi:2-oxoglutarate ferredoxin oxidoreductase subunit delta
MYFAGRSVRKAVHAMTSPGPARKIRGTVRVKPHICKGCSYCIDFCPSNCLTFSSEYNPKGYHFPVMARPEDCTGCGLCEQYCPDFAIRAFRVTPSPAAASAASGDTSGGTAHAG